MSDIARFLAAIRMVEDADYGRMGPPENGVTPFGAYGMLTSNWESWSSAARLSGHDKFDPAAQDAVATHWAQRLFSRYGSWDMVAAAWYAGAEQADRAATSGDAAGWFRHPKTKEYLTKFTEAFASDEAAQARVPTAGRKWVNLGSTPKGWLMPVAGKNEYSNSFRVPRDNKTGIHGAIDIYAKRGTPIVAPVGGEVLSTKRGDVGGYTVKVRGADGLIYYFAHMDSAAVVRPGERIEAGAHLGFVGDSGNARGTSPHLHFSVRQGNTPVNPFTYLEGARNAGNYYDPQDAAHETEQKEPTATRFVSLLNTVSNRVAGGSRTDYRTLGVDETQDDTSDERDVVSAEKGPY